MSIMYIAYRILWVFEIDIGGRFSEDCFYYYSKQIISAATNESLTPYNVIKRAQET